MQVWRLKTNSGGEQAQNQTLFCVRESVAGFGWQVDPSPLDLDDYRTKAQQYFVDGAISGGHKPDWGWSTALKALVERAADGDLVWARDGHPTYEYWLGRIGGEWRYEAVPRFMDADIVNVRRCSWVKIGGPECVPASVRNSYAGLGQVLRLVGDETTLWASVLLWNRSGGTPKLFFEPPRMADLFELIGQDELEDVVSVYLQVRYGYLSWPSTKIRTLPGIESVFVSRDGDHAAVMQVKGGNVDLDVDQFLGIANPTTRVFLFAASGLYPHREKHHPHIVCVEPDELRQFVLNNRKLLPPVVRTWIDECRL